MGHSTALTGIIYLKEDTPKEVLDLLYNLFEGKLYRKENLPDHELFQTSWTWGFSGLFSDEYDKRMFEKYIDFQEERGLFYDPLRIQLNCASKSMYHPIIEFLDWITPYTKDTSNLWMADEDGWQQLYVFDGSNFIINEHENKFWNSDCGWW